MTQRVVPKSKFANKKKEKDVTSFCISNIINITVGATWKYDYSAVNKFWSRRPEFESRWRGMLWAPKARAA